MKQFTKILIWSSIVLFAWSSTFAFWGFDWNNTYKPQTLSWVKQRAMQNFNKVNNLQNLQNRIKLFKRQLQYTHDKLRKEIYQRNISKMENQINNIRDNMNTQNDNMRVNTQSDRDTQNDNMRVNTQSDRDTQNDNMRVNTQKLFKIIPSKIQNIINNKITNVLQSRLYNRIKQLSKDKQLTILNKIENKINQIKSKINLNNTRNIIKLYAIQNIQKNIENYKTKLNWISLNFLQNLIWK